MRRGQGAEGDEGIAALEMGIISTLLLLLAFAALPLFAMMHGYQKVNSASADTLRYATSVDANPHVVRTNADGTQVISRRPTRNDITRFAQAAANDSALVVTVTVYQGSGTTTRTAAAGDDPIEALSGDTVTVTVAKDVDLSLLGAVANAAAGLVGQGDVAPHGIQTMSSTATAREE
jgi:Flp pilus assembly protein TadG